MNRRSFLGALAALPIIGRIVPQAVATGRVLQVTISSEFSAVVPAGAFCDPYYDALIADILADNEMPAESQSRQPD